MSIAIAISNAIAKAIIITNYEKNSYTTIGIPSGDSTSF